MLSIPPVKYRKRRGRPRADRRAPVAPLTLVAAAFDGENLFVTLTFDRPIDVSGMDAAALSVDDAAGTGEAYVGVGTPTIVGADAVDVAVGSTGPAGGSGTRLTVGAGNGIVAADDGAAWAGVTDLALPFP